MCLTSLNKVISIIYIINEFKCNLKELTTKSAWVPRSAVFGMRMPGGWLHRSCDSLARSVFPSCWVLSAIFFPSRPPPRLVGFFSTDVFSVWRVPVPFLWYGGSWLGCTVVPVMGALFQSRGWLPIVEAPGYFRHPTSILAMQLLINYYYYLIIIIIIIIITVIINYFIIMATICYKKAWGTIDFSWEFLNIIIGWFSISFVS